MIVLFDLLGNKKMKRAMTHLSSLLILSMASFGCISTQSFSNTSAYTTDEMTMEYPSAFDTESIFTDDTSEMVATQNKNLLSDYTMTSTFDHSLWNDILNSYVNKEGLVNYKGLFDNRSQLNKYIELLVNNVPDENWSRNEQLAYWMKTKKEEEEDKGREIS